MSLVTQSQGSHMAGPASQTSGVQGAEAPQEQGQQGEGRLPTNGHCSVAALTSISKGYTHL